MNNSLQINFDPTFVEESVFLSIRATSDEKLFREFCDEKEEVYRQYLSDEDRDKEFKALYEKYFCSLGLLNFFKNICGHFPHLYTPEIRVVVKRVWHRKHEEAELYVQPHQKTVYLGILVRRVLNLAFLESFLWHELMRISDMLSLDFQYSPHPAFGGKNEMEDNLIRERFRLLWDIYIDVRLKRNGIKTIKLYEQQTESFERMFFYLTAREREQILCQIRACENLLQMDLLHWAGDPRSIKTLGEGGRRCPLCDFTSFEPVAHWNAKTLLVVNEIRKDYPLWEQRQGVCPQCFDLYALKIKTEV